MKENKEYELNICEICSRLYMLSMFSFWMILVFCCFCNDKLAHSDIGDVDSHVRIHQLVFRKKLGPANDDCDVW